MKLFEQIYRGNRVYYHGSPHRFESFEERNDYNADLEPAIFLSTDEAFAIWYAKTRRRVSDAPVERTVYTCKISPRLDLFNASSASDLRRLKSHNPAAHDEFVSTYMSETRGLRFWQVMEKPGIIAATREIGYDGYTTQESGSENVALFNSRDVKILVSRTLEDAIRDQSIKNEHGFSITQRALDNIAMYGNPKGIVNDLTKSPVVRDMIDGYFKRVGGIKANVTWLLEDLFDRADKEGVLSQVKIVMKRLFKRLDEDN